MSRENVDRFIEATEAFNRGDVSAYLRLMDPEVQFEPVQAALEGTYAGRGGVREWFADIAEHYVLESSHVRYTEIRDLGDRVLGIGTLRFTGKGSGISSETSLALIVSYRNGLITHMKDYGDKNKALEAVGLSE
jgi:ketosteroid isomerase-like protein